MSSIQSMLMANAARFGQYNALLSIDGAALSHEELYEKTLLLARELRRIGIGSQDRVALVFPQGVELARAFLGAAVGATAAPLNPAYTSTEFEFNLRDLRARALLVPRDFDTPARAAAMTLGIPVIELASLPDGGGLGNIFAADSETASALNFTQPEDVVLMLHTSGTTSRPKRVPLRNANLCASASNVSASLELGPGDVSLSTMPLFHIHGLVCMLAALSAGGSCVCTGPFRADRFASWIERWNPTWFSTVPTVLQSILDCARDTPFKAASLRLIRSSSASLPPTVMAELKARFAVPVIEAYGMTEAAHQMTSNPLPPRERRSGSVGMAAGPQVAILDEGGAQLGHGKVGEVAIQGTNVTSGYENNPDANAAAYSDGWFRTGDQGYFDKDGYLFLTGRLKELINRGGEKIVPREIDEALLAHPAVRQAVTFAVAHSSLGEDVAAAVVLHTNAVSCEAMLREYLFERMADFKVPSRIVLVDAIPMGPTGKMQRIGMAARLGRYLAPAYEPPADKTEELIAATISDVLKLDRFGRADNFFSSGGDSLRGTQVMVRIGRELGLDLPVPLLFHLPTPRLLAARLDELIASREVAEIAAAFALLSPEEQSAMLASMDAIAS